MSYTQAATDLVTSANALVTEYRNKKAEIDASVAAAIAAAPKAAREVYVDPVNGDDANIGSMGAPVMSADRAMEILADVPIARLRLLGDATITRRHRFYGSSLEVSGWRYDAAQGKLDRQKRVLSFASEAPVNWDGSRHVAGLYLNGDAILDGFTVDFNIPIIDPALKVKTLIDFWGGGGLFLSSCGVTAANADTTAALARVSLPRRLTIGMTGTVIAAEAKGKVLYGIAADADPNANWHYQSNVTAL